MGDGGGETERMGAGEVRGRLAPVTGGGGIGPAARLRLARRLERGEVAAAMTFFTSDEAGRIGGRALVLDRGGIQA